jgi:hypothetical protein
MVDLSAERMTDLIIDFIADEPFLLTITLLTISFNFLSLNLSSDATTNPISDFVLMLFRFFTILVFWFLRGNLILRSANRERSEHGSTCRKLRSGWGEEWSQPDDAAMDSTLASTFPISFALGGPWMARAAARLSRTERVLAH